MYFTGSDGRSNQRSDKPSACPKCGSTTVAAIRYGMPGPEPDDAIKTGEVVLGGCVVDERARHWQCLSCNVSFNDGGEDLLEPIDYRPQWMRERQE